MPLGHPADHEVPHPAGRVGDERAVDRLHPERERGRHVVDGARSQQGQEGGETQVEPDLGGRAQAVRRGRRLGAAAPFEPGDDRAASGDHHGHLDVGSITHHHRLDRLHDRLPPLQTSSPQPTLGRTLQLLDREVLVVGHGVGDSPRDGAGVGEVLHAGHAGKAEPHHVELGAGEADLLVAAGQVDGAVRVTGQQRLCGGRAVAPDHPRVAARAGLTLGREQR